MFCIRTHQIIIMTLISPFMLSAIFCPRGCHLHVMVGQGLFFFLLWLVAEIQKLIARLFSISLWISSGEVAADCWTLPSCAWFDLHYATFFRDYIFSADDFLVGKGGKLQLDYIFPYICYSATLWRAAGFPNEPSKNVCVTFPKHRMPINGITSSKPISSSFYVR